MTAFFLMTAFFISFSQKLLAQDSTGIAFQTLARSAEEHEKICQALKNPRTCALAEQQMKTVLKINPAMCPIINKSLNCEGFIKQNPKYQSRQMDCGNLYDICRHGTLNVTVQGCANYGYRVTSDAINAYKSFMSCATDRDCFRDNVKVAAGLLGQEIWKLMTTSPVIYAAQKGSEFGRKIAQDFLDDQKAFHTLRCLNPEAKVERACELLVKYGGAVTATAGAARVVATTGARLALGGKALRAEAVTASKPAPPRAAPQVTASPKPVPLKASQPRAGLAGLIVAGNESADAIKNRLLHFDPATDSDRESMISFINTSAQRGSQVIDIENSVMQKMNSILDQDLVTALTNHHKLLIKSKFDALFEKHKGLLEYKQYSDFKSQRFALIPKKPATSIPASVIKEFEQAYIDANRELSAKVYQMNLKTKTDGSLFTELDPKKWFRAGIDSNADEANWNSRLSREMPRQEGFARSSDASIQQSKFKVFEEINRSSFGILKALGTTSPLLRLSDGAYILRAEVFDLIKKSKYDVVKIRNRLRYKYPGQTISDQAIDEMIKTAKLTDRVQPSIWQTTRTVSTIEKAKHGGLIIDVKGMGAHNAEQALLHSIKCTNPAAMANCTRLGEREVTRAFQEKMAKIRDVSLQHCREVRLKCSITISGDDVRIIPENGALPQGFAVENLNRINSSVGPAQIRQAEIIANVPETVRVVMGQHGEDIEKLIGDALSQSLLSEQAHRLTFSVQMKTTQVDAGLVQIQAAGPGLSGLSAADQKLLKKIMADSLRQFNGEKPGRHYQIAP
jgi:hypothetical protein